MVMESQLRNQLAASVRSINWSYALFWSISSTQPAPGILTWTDGFYNGEVKTTKIANSAKLTANQLIMRRSEQLRELYEALCSGKCDRRAARPVASLSPQDLGNTEWYYMVSMTYAFRPGQGLPGRCFASNERVWMGNAHLAHNKAFPRAILAQSTSIQTIVCIPLMGGVLELGATHEVVEDPDLIRRATAAFWGMQFPACSEEPSSSRLASERGKPAGDIIVFKEIDHIFMEAMIAGDEQELGEAESLSDASLEHITTEIDQFYSLCDVQALDDTWIMDGSFEVPSLPQQALGAAASATNNIAATSSAAVDGPRETCFTAWARPESDSDEAAVLVVEEPQKLLRKAVGGRAWAANNGGGSTTRTDEEGGIKNHILTERKRREKLNKMFLILKSLVPSIDKVDKASILAETIAYLKELQQRVQELESSREPMISHPSETTKATKRHDDDETVRMGSGSKRKGSELGSGVEREHPCVLSEDGSSTVTVTVSDKEVLVDVHCRWEELMMTRVFDAIKSLQLDILSVQASAPDGFMGLNIRAQLAGSAAVVPWMISEALREAIGKR